MRRRRPGRGIPEGILLTCPTEANPQHRVALKFILEFRDGPIASRKLGNCMRRITGNRASRQRHRTRSEESQTEHVGNTTSFVSFVRNAAMTIPARVTHRGSPSAGPFSHRTLARRLADVQRSGEAVTDQPFDGYVNR